MDIDCVMASIFGGDSDEDGDDSETYSGSDSEDES